MPEGPEIRIAADSIAAALVGRRATGISFAHRRLQKFERRLRGLRVDEVQTRGKAILTCFENDWVIYSHNQLYGRWYVCPAGMYPDTRRQLRVAIHNSKTSALLYSASEIEVLHRQDLDKQPFLARLGPDILGEQPGIEQILGRLQAKQFRNRQLGGLLLDQGFLAGLGNYLRAEILTLAGLHPARKASECDARQLRKLAGLIISITRRAYRTRGVTNPPGLVKRLKVQGMSAREAYRFNTYGREGQPCHYCGAAIESLNSGGRKMYFCPGCQPRTASSRV